MHERSKDNKIVPRLQEQIKIALLGADKCAEAIFIEVSYVICCSVIAIALEHPSEGFRCSILRVSMSVRLV